MKQIADLTVTTHTHVNISVDSVLWRDGLIYCQSVCSLSQAQLRNQESTATVRHLPWLRSHSTVSSFSAMTMTVGNTDTRPVNKPDPLVCKHSPRPACSNCREGYLSKNAKPNAMHSVHALCWNKRLGSILSATGNRNTHDGYQTTSTELTDSKGLGRYVQSKTLNRVQYF